MNEYHAKAKHGIKLLLGRQLFVQLITFGGGIILARTLDPADFGLYIISLFMVNMFALIGDFGLAPSFIQRKKELTDLEIQVGFTLQQVLTSILVIILFCGGPAIGRYLYPDIPQVVWLVRALSFNLYLTSWRSMSALQLERHMKYDQLAKIEVLEMLVYQSLAVGLALLGAHTWSYIIASLVQGVLGTTLIYLASPWKIRLKYDSKIASELLRFGVPFQLQIIINSLGSWATPLIVGRQLGPDAVGFVTWASSNGRKPLMITDSVMRVAFPHFSRIQDDLIEVERIVIRYLSGLLMAATLWFTGIVCTTPALIELVYKQKWAPASTALTLYSAVLALDMCSMVIGTTLTSIGRLNLTTIVVTVRSALNIILTITLVFLMRRGHAYNGVPIAYLVSSIIAVPWLMRGLGPGACYRISRSLSWLLIPTGVGVSAGLTMSWLSQTTWLPVHVLVTGCTAVLGYTIATWFACPKWMRDKTMESFKRLSVKLPAAAPLP